VAADALRRIGGTEATEALLVALAQPQDTARWHAAMGAVEAMGEEAVGPLTGMLSSKEADARRNAATALGWIGSPSATAALVDMLEDENAAVREQAAWALGEIGDPAGRAALEHAQARDASPVVQLAATAALSRVEGRPVVRAGWPATWAPALHRLQPLRWSILALTLAGAAWLVLGHKSLSLLPVSQQEEGR
jgi:HEAT repeat protein